MTIVSHRNIFAIALIAAIPLLGVAAARLLLHIDIPVMTADVAAIAHIHPLSGFLSSLGILLWWTSATLWFFAALLRRRRQQHADSGFYIFSGLLSAYFALDDLFQFHEDIARAYLNMSEKAVYGVLGLTVVFYLWRYRRTLHRPETILLLLALAFLFASAVIDEVLEPWMWHFKEWAFFIEDGLKWMGICFWTAFSIARCTRDLK